MLMLLHLLPFAPLIGLLIWAAVEDAACRKIRNWLTFSLVLTGVAQSFTSVRTVTPADSALGLAVGLALPLALFAIGALGGGDVKLLAGIGAWVGVVSVLRIFAAEAIIGMIVVLVQAAATGRLAMLARNSAVVAVNIIHVNQLGVEHAAASGRGCRSIDRPLPFAVPVLAATLFVMYVWMR